MNSVSWFLYLAGVLDSLGSLMAFGLIGSTICFCILWIVWGLSQTEEGKIADRITEKKLWKIPLYLIFVFGAVGVFFPTKGTVYAIAASQVGERVANSEAVKGMADDATKALQIWIKKQIDPVQNKN